MFSVFKDPESTPTKESKKSNNKELNIKESTVLQSTNACTKALHSRSLSDSARQTSAAVESKCKSTPSSPSKRALTQTPKYLSNKENWDSKLQLYSNDRQAKKVRGLAVDKDRTPLTDITALYQSRIDAAQNDVFVESILVSQPEDQELAEEENISQIQVIVKQFKANVMQSRLNITEESTVFKATVSTASEEKVSYFSKRKTRSPIPMENSRKRQFLVLQAQLWRIKPLTNPKRYQ